MTTYPPEMLPSPDEGEGATIIVCRNDGCPKDAEIARLRKEVALWKDRWEAERQAHDATYESMLHDQP